MTSVEDLMYRSFKKKAWTLFTIMIMTTTVYMASAIWSPAVTIGAEHFGVSELVSTLGITTFGRSQVSSLSWIITLES